MTLVTYLRHNEKHGISFDKNAFSEFHIFVTVTYFRFSYIFIYIYIFIYLYISYIFSTLSTDFSDCVDFQYPEYVFVVYYTL